MEVVRIRGNGLQFVAGRGTHRVSDRLACRHQGIFQSASPLL